MAERCEICGREKNAMAWLPGREWCGGPIDPDAMIECYRLGYERERAARERARELEKLFLGTLAGLVTGLPGDPEQIDEWVRGRVAYAKHQYNALLAAPRGEPAAEPRAKGETP